ncbi:phospholipase C, phosphocholine-specific [Chromobacterium subtsugae]|uniref:phospholipase C n=1 Tax=Chromobacterium subtsugae TaxID=251747 RepID=A0ABS7FKC5_9NEIS|nr:MULTISPECIES: phospholipase C, phosphocholine-specific [Chromobacterium]KUM03801.1 phospholipase C, phosphocholine-specific [Chromobacterium subtsugae]KZE85534.1 phospholipase C, phosphocholine-specific [Chromobacterium sp. F49]MBW7568935.1 phospholipase C, phosphocholine-specific [Chromobacterium subtsugae]MBW8289945.1 phospholipase C, phosphocholine-specific [Chromobacterium subtsugae]OBU84754.1 phospholipase C [Chromobacterium subtsugae]
MSELSRREFLKLSAAGVAAGAIPPGLAAAMAIRPAGRSLSAVKHVVVFMQENRSFDHYFGMLRGVRGFGDRSALQLRNGSSVFRQPHLLSSEFPFHLDSSRTNAQYLTDLDHSWTGTHAAWNQGKYDGWVAAKTGLTMGYFNRADIPYHYALADAFTICDGYFCSQQGPTNPNRLYLWSGTVDAAGKNGGPVTDNSEKGYSWTTYPERLQAAGVSWKVYQVVGDNFDDNALAWFTQYRNAKPGNPLHDRGMSSVPKVSGNSVKDLVAAIRSDAVNGTLPQVSWIVAPQDYSEHPSAPPAAGAYLVDQVLQALTANPDVWASTVMLLNYDENDGLFDHVPPPVPPSGTAGEFVSGAPIGLGPRVPLLVLSPWSRGGYVCSQVFDHTSVLRFLETWSGVQEPNISAWRRQVCGDLTAALDFGSSNTSLPAFPDTAALLTQAQQSKGWPAPTAPVPGQMPQPEAGRRPARALPYQCNAYASTDVAGGMVWIHMQNSGSQGAHYAIYANQYRLDGPWQYDVAAGGNIQDYFHVQTYGGGWYDLTLYGPNGFLRRFAGNIHSAAGVLEAVSGVSVVQGVPQLTLQLNNGGKVAATFQVSANGYGGGAPQQVSVNGGGSQLLSWNLSGVYGWYDFTVTCSNDTSFIRRLVGHVENGAASVSG